MRRHLRQNALPDASFLSLGISQELSLARDVALCLFSALIPLDGFANRETVVF
jgi:hypothetical protein